MSVSMLDPDAERAAWLDWRRQGVGASDVAAILGLSKWASPWTVWANKLELLPDSEPTPKMEAGQFAELMIGPLFELRTGLVVGRAQARIEAESNPIHRATLDGLAYEEDSSDAQPVAIVEMKNEDSWSWPDGPPVYYETQGQWQMHCSGLDVCFFAVLHRGWDLQVYRLERDQADIDAMVELVDRFWTDHVLTGTPPPPDDHEATAKALAKVYPGGGDGAIAVDDIAEDLVALVEAKAATKEAKRAEAEVANRIKARIGNAHDGTVGGRLAVSWRPWTKEAYRVEAQEGRTLRLHGDFNKGGRK